MNYEEKYKHALERASKLRVQNPFDTVGQMVEHIFPELKESEDERMKKAIMHVLYENYTDAAVIEGVEIAEIVTWLEKQGEKKPVSITDEWIADYWQHYKIINPYSYDKGEEIQFDYQGFVSFCRYIVRHAGWSEAADRPHRYLLEKQSKKFDADKMIARLEKQGEPEDKGEISDGYHTFNELYSYRMLYNAAFFNLLPKQLVHKSKRHHDGEECFGGGWFIVMANLPTGQISNHYELKDWDLFQIPEKDVADEWDGHTPQDAANRLHEYLLEKQGEQKLTDNIEPKFKVGDWIVYDKTKTLNDVFCVIEVLEEIYKVIDIDGDDYHIPLCQADKQFHLWTIEDVKDGDVLVYETNEVEWIFIYREIVPAASEVPHDILRYYFLLEGNYCNWNGVSAMVTDDYELYLKPATKEQRDLLFQKIKEAGYEWDAEKKEVKKIEQKTLDADEVIDWIDSTICNAYNYDGDDISTKLKSKFKEDFGL